MFLQLHLASHLYRGRLGHSHYHLLAVSTAFVELWSLAGLGAVMPKPFYSLVQLLQFTTVLLGTMEDGVPKVPFHLQTMQDITL